MKTSREQFECEMSKFGDCVDMRRAKNGDQEYMACDVGLAWRMWQASRQCIEVELTFYCDGYKHDKEIIDSLRDAGIKIKGA